MVHSPDHLRTRIQLPMSLASSQHQRPSNDHRLQCFDIIAVPMQTSVARILHSGNRQQRHTLPLVARPASHRCAHQPYIAVNIAGSSESCILRLRHSIMTTMNSHSLTLVTRRSPFPRDTHGHGVSRLREPTFVSQQSHGRAGFFHLSA